jgi:hypothetical protein
MQRQILRRGQPRGLPDYSNICGCVSDIDLRALSFCPLDTLVLSITDLFKLYLR